MDKGTSGKKQCRYDMQVQYRAKNTGKAVRTVMLKLRVPSTVQLKFVADDSGH